MALINWIFARGAGENDRKRDEGRKYPEGIIELRDVVYSPEDKAFGLYDLYRPEELKAPLPLIVVVHGGGFVYGDKEVYRHYSMRLAKKGYCVCCFSYMLAPMKRFPCQIEMLDKVLSSLAKLDGEWKIDRKTALLFGDSAGASLSFIYSLAYSNAEYRKLYPNLKFDLPPTGLALNCGLYGNLGENRNNSMGWMWRAYLPRPKRKWKDDPRFFTIRNVRKGFPKTYLMTSDGDFLLSENAPLMEAFDKEGVEYKFREFKGEKEPLPHVFHLGFEKESEEAMDEAIAYLDPK